MAIHIEDRQPQKSTNHATSDLDLRSTKTSLAPARNGKIAVAGQGQETGVKMGMLAERAHGVAHRMVAGFGQCHCAAGMYRCGGGESGKRPSGVYMSKCGGGE